MKCLIKICDRHVIDGEDENSELVTVGTIEGSNEDYTLRYNEQTDEMKNCVTCLHYEKSLNKVTMQRTGDFNSELIMEQNVRHICCYSTPVGEISIGIYANSVDSDMDTDVGGNLDFSYDMDFNAGFVSVNTLNITVKVKK